MEYTTIQILITGFVLKTHNMFNPLKFRNLEIVQKKVFRLNTLKAQIWNSVSPSKLINTFPSLGHLVNHPRAIGLGIWEFTYIF